MSNATRTFELPVRPSWFQNGTKHHIYLSAPLARALGAPDNRGSVDVAVYVNDENIANGKLQGKTWFLTEVDDVFDALDITNVDADSATVLAQGRPRDGHLELHLWRPALRHTLEEQAIAPPHPEPNNPDPPAPAIEPEGLDEDLTGEAAPEGAVREIRVNAFERDANLRKGCIAYYGVACVACGFRFEEMYGQLGAGFIHVHHIVPLAAIAAQHQVDPIADLRPLCANCHAMIHRRRPALTIAELLEAINAARAAS